MDHSFKKQSTTTLSMKPFPVNISGRKYMLQMNLIPMNYKDSERLKTNTDELINDLIIHNKQVNVKYDEITIGEDVKPKFLKYEVLAENIKHDNKTAEDKDSKLSRNDTLPLQPSLADLKSIKVKVDLKYDNNDVPSSKRYVKKLSEETNQEKLKGSDKKLSEETSQEKLLKCKKCDFSTTKKVYHKFHVKIAHKVPKKAFSCNECEYSTSLKGNLKTHKRTVHQGLKPFKCDLCDHAASQKIHIENHRKRVHQRVKPFKCNQCKYSALQQIHIVYHKRAVHLGLKPFKCNKCKYAASTKGILNTHVKVIHKGLKPFKCDWCNHQTAQKGNLLTHIKNIHKDRWNQ